MISKVVKFIEDNRISSTEIADVLGKSGLFDCASILNKGHYKVGEVVLVYAINNSNYEVHRQLAEKDIIDKILLIYNVNCDRAIFGDLVSKYVLLYKHAKAIVVNGKLRDAHTLIKENYPIWCNGMSPIGCVNYSNGEDIDEKLLAQLKEKYEGGIMVCDDSGVVLIPKEKINEKLLNGLHFIEYQEDIWFYCLDTLKMSTYDIVCKKRYLMDEMIDKHLLERLAKLDEEK